MNNLEFIFVFCLVCVTIAFYVITGYVDNLNTCYYDISLDATLNATELNALIFSTADWPLNETKIISSVELNGRARLPCDPKKQVERK